MESQKKTIQQLTVSLDSQRESLASHYCQFGAKLLNDSADPVIFAATVQPEKTETWQSLRASREEDTNTVLEIKRTVARMQELNQFSKELKKTISEALDEKNAALFTAGFSLFTHFQDEKDPVFSVYFDQANAQSIKIIALEDELSAFRRSLEEANFFSRMMSQLKLTGMNNTLKQEKERFEALVRKNMEAILEDGSIQERLGSAEIQTLAGDALRVLEACENKLCDYSDREKSLEAEVASLKGYLQNHAALTNTNRRLDELTQKLKETDKRMDSLAGMTAKDYCDRFLDEEGNFLTPVSGNGENRNVYQQQLEQCSRIRKNIWDTGRTIEILETNLKIEGLDRSVMAWERSAKDYEARIERYREMIAVLEKNIADASQEKVRLTLHREELEGSAKPSGQ